MVAALSTLCRPRRNAAAAAGPFAEVGKKLEQWQRELKDKFRENFQVVRSHLLRANYGVNPWQEIDQCITSVSWVSRIEDADESLMRSRWDLVIVDEGHKMSAYGEEKKTLAYHLGEALSERTDHYLLMTATPHKGDPVNFSFFLRLLDPDVHGDVKSLERAMDEREAPFYLRRVKEALVSFPDPDTCQAKSLPPSGSSGPSASRSTTTNSTSTTA